MFSYFITVSVIFTSGSLNVKMTLDQLLLLTTELSKDKPVCCYTCFLALSQRRDGSDRTWRYGYDGPYQVQWMGRPHLLPMSYHHLMVIFLFFANWITIYFVEFFNCARMDVNLMVLTSLVSDCMNAGCDDGWARTRCGIGANVFSNWGCWKHSMTGWPSQLIHESSYLYFILFKFCECWSHKNKISASTVGNAGM